MGLVRAKKNLNKYKRVGTNSLLVSTASKCWGGSGEQNKVCLIMEGHSSGDQKDKKQSHMNVR